MKTRTSLVLLALAATVTTGAADEAARGLYEVQVTLDLPHVTEAGTTKSERVCVDPGDVSYGLKVLSDNNPLAKCPIRSLRTTEAGIVFEIACRGVNAAVGHASYRFWLDRFEGRIDMKMGGKNMTMTEVQRGRRVGECAPAAGH